MIEREYLSEVEVAYVQKQVLVDVVPQNRLTSIWAVVGKDVHGFAAVIESKEQVGSSWLVKFSPVTDIVALHAEVGRYQTFADGQTEETEEVWAEFHRDPTAHSKKELAMYFMEKSKFRDDEKICEATPTIGEDVVALEQPKALFYAVTYPHYVDAALLTGLIRSKVGYLILKGQRSPEEQLQRRFGYIGKELAIITCQEMSAEDAKAKEALILTGLRAAMKCATGSEWFELPYSKGTEWEIGRQVTADLIEGFEAVGQDFENGHFIGQL